MPSNSLQVAFTFNSTAVLFDDNRLVNLTNMWRAAGSTPNKEPREWKRQAGASFINHTASSLNVGLTHVLRSEPGRNGGTWAHWQIALAYAKYLSDEFHTYVNSAFKEWIEEKESPGLKVERGIEGYQRQGKDAPWIKARVVGIVARKDFTGTLADHGCKNKGRNDNPFSETTNSINLAALGMTTREFREDKGISDKSTPTRDVMSEEQLIWVRLAEIRATEHLRKKAADGNTQCVECVREVATVVKASREAFNNQLGLPAA